MAKGRINDFYSQYEKLVEKYEMQEKTLKETNALIKSLNKTIKTLNETIEKQNKTIEELNKEILRLKTKNDRDSSNSSKPSGTNGYKKVITNRREKSDKKKGGQLNHVPHSLKNKLDKFIKSGDVIEEIVEINKNDYNKDKRYIEKIVIDIKMVKVVKRYRYYIHEDGKYHIPEYHNQYVQYGSNIKSIAMDLMINLPNSTDGIVRFINDLSNGGISLSKGTLINWQKELANKSNGSINTIENKLLDAYYLNADESQIKIDGELYNVLCVCNNKYVRLWPSKHKSQEAIDEINFLPKYKGIIVKDGTELYNKYGLYLSQCISHILRYLKGIYDYVDHKGPKKLSDFLTKINNKRNEYIKAGKKSFSKEEYNSFISEYDNIINEWEIELKNDTKNHLFDEEYNLFKRLKYDCKKMNKDIRGDKEEILYFIKDFKVPSTNNAAEVSQRGVKIKQKNGKFRSFEGAENYLIIKSCILTFKKLELDILKSIKTTFEGKTVLA